MAAGRRRRVTPALRRHRRVLAALLVGVAGAVTVHALSPEPAGVPVTVAAHDLAAGARLEASDLTTALVPPGVVPDGAVDADDLDGARLASPVRRGEPVTDVRVGGAGAASALPVGQVAVPVRLVPESRPWVGVGQRLRLHPVAAADPLGSGSAPTRAGVEVVVLDLVDDPAVGGGVLGPVPSDRSAVDALVQVGDDDAARLLAGAGEPVRAVLLGP